MEQEMPDYETIRAAVTGEKWALEKVLDCYGDEINHLAMVKKASAGRNDKRRNRRRFTANTHTETVRSYPTIPNRKGVIP